MENIVKNMESYTAAPELRSLGRLRDVLVAAIELAQENVRHNRLDPGPVSLQLDVCELIRVPLAQHQIDRAHSVAPGTGKK